MCPHTTSTLGSYVTFKDKEDGALGSNVVYNVHCEQCSLSYTIPSYTKIHQYQPNILVYTSYTMIYTRHYLVQQTCQYARNIPLYTTYISIYSKYTNVHVHQTYAGRWIYRAVHSSVCLSCIYLACNIEKVSRITNAYINQYLIRKIQIS